METLSSSDRMRLMRFICSFAWADLEVSQKERSFVRKYARKLHLDAPEAKQVSEWLEVPPKPESIDPMAIPAQHKELFLEAVREVIRVDGVFDPAEEENLRVLKELLSA